MRKFYKQIIQDHNYLVNSVIPDDIRHERTKKLNTNEWNRFIPIFNFWKPHHVTQQIWKASNPEVHLTEGTEWKKSTSSILVKQWWALSNCNYRFGYCRYFLWNLHGFWYGIEQLDQSTDLTLLAKLPTIPFQVLTIISIILFIRILKQISTWHSQKSINLWSLIQLPFKISIINQYYDWKKGSLDQTIYASY